MSLKLRLTDDMKAAMKSGDKQTLGVVRLMLAAIKQREVDERIELDDAAVLAALEKMVKQRRDSVSQYEAASREDLAQIERDEIVRVRLARHPALLREWSNAVAAAPWPGPPVWVHGDVHAGNIVLEDERIVAVIDFGDLSSGDPACDLAAAWLMFTPTGRTRFRRRMGDRYDDAAWTRARGWVAAMASLVLDADDAGLHRMATHAIGELTRDPA